VVALVLEVTEGVDHFGTALREDEVLLVGTLAYQHRHRLVLALVLIDLQDIPTLLLLNNRTDH
jgi:hypothetical protein